MDSKEIKAGITVTVSGDATEFMGTLKEIENEVDVITSKVENLNTLLKKENQLIITVKSNKSAD